MFKPEDFEKFKDTMKSRPEAERIGQHRDRARRFHAGRHAVLDVGTGQVHALRAQACAGLSTLPEQAWKLVSHCVEDPAIDIRPVRQAYPPSQEVRKDVAEGFGPLLAQRRAASLEQSLPAPSRPRLRP